MDILKHETKVRNVFKTNHFKFSPPLHNKINTINLNISELVFALTSLQVHSRMKVYII